MKVTQYLAVNGTHENRTPEGHWSHPESPISQYLERYGLLNIAHSAMLPFDWSDDLNFTAGHPDWIAAGASLNYYLVPPLRPEYAWPSAETVLVTHSHGLQPALYAARMGLKIDRLLSIAGPVRKDMMEVARLARPNIRRWMHVYSDATDRWQWLGELFDGHFGIVRKHALADENVEVKGVGHGGLIRDPKQFHQWADRGLINFLKGA